MIKLSYFYGNNKRLGLPGYKTINFSVLFYETRLQLKLRYMTQRKNLRLDKNVEDDRCLRCPF